VSWSYYREIIPVQIWKVKEIRQQPRPESANYNPLAIPSKLRGVLTLTIWSFTKKEVCQLQLKQWVKLPTESLV
jgi:hypothetical protein